MTVNKNTFVIGFMLFAIFFGAGNLIFPSALGLESGQTFWPALLGFVSRSEEHTSELQSQR